MNENKIMTILDDVADCKRFMTNTVKSINRISDNLIKAGQSNYMPSDKYMADNLIELCALYAHLSDSCAKYAKIIDNTLDNVDY